MISEAEKTNDVLNFEVSCSRLAEQASADQSCVCVCLMKDGLKDKQRIASFISSQFQVTT